MEEKQSATLSFYHDGFARNFTHSEAALVMPVRSQF
jgi:hypothetical protein